jgi:Sulfotransferase domain
MDTRTRIARTAKHLAPAWAKGAALRAIREYGIATERMRGLPDFLIIGGKRCATTTLYWHLVQHPDVAPLFPRAKRIKGVHFFDWNYHRGVPWYRSHFPSTPYRGMVRLGRGRPPIAGEASSSYLFHPHAPGRARRVVPGTRLIVLMRNPVDRAWSHYRARVRLGQEPLSFEEAIAAEPARVAGERGRAEADPSYRSYPLEQQAYTTLGRYADPLARWIDLFAREQILVVLVEDLAREPSRTYQSVLHFLGLPPWEPPRFRPLNVGSGTQEMRHETRIELATRFAPDNARLVELLGIDPGWDRD